MAKVLGIDLGTANSCMAVMDGGRFKQDQGMDLRKQPDALQRIKDEAEKAKIALSMHELTRAIEQKVVNNPGIHEREGHLWIERRLNALRQLKRWSWVLATGTVACLAVLLLWSAGTVFLAIQLALDGLMVKFRRVMS